MRVVWQALLDFVVIVLAIIVAQTIIDLVQLWTLWGVL